MAPFSKDVRERLIIALTSELAGKEVADVVDGLSAIVDSGNISGSSSTFTGSLSGAVTSVGMVTSQVESYVGHLDAPTNKTYFLDFKAAFAGTLNSLDIGSISGTCTVDIKINGVAVTGLSAIAVSNSTPTALATALNAFAAGAQITIVISANSAATDLAFTLKYTR